MRNFPVNQRQDEKDFFAMIERHRNTYCTTAGYTWGLANKVVMVVDPGL